MSRSSALKNIKKWFCFYILEMLNWPSPSSKLHLRSRLKCSCSNQEQQIYFMWKMLNIHMTSDSNSNDQCVCHIIGNVDSSVSKEIFRKRNFDKMCRLVKRFGNIGHNRKVCQGL